MDADHVKVRSTNRRFEATPGRNFGMHTDSSTSTFQSALDGPIVFRQVHAIALASDPGTSSRSGGTRDRPMRHTVVRTSGVPDPAGDEGSLLATAMCAPAAGGGNECELHRTRSNTSGERDPMTTSCVVPGDRRHGCGRSPALVLTISYRTISLSALRMNA